MSHAEVLTPSPGQPPTVYVGGPLTQQAILELPMPRDVQVRATRLLPDGDLVLAGTRDGPLTHTEPSMTHNDGFWGIARIGSIDAIRSGLR